MSLFLKVPRRLAESARKKVLSLGIYDSSRKATRNKAFVFFPLKEKLEIEGCEIIDRSGQRSDIRPHSLYESLSGILSAEELAILPTSFDVVGDIAILEFTKKFPIETKDIVALALIETFKNIHTVLEKTEKVSGKHRVRGVRHLAGDEITDTLHREYGCVHHVDIARDYFSPRLATERMRVVSQVKEGERVLVLFAGVGPYAILAAKKRKPSEVVAVEVNPHAVQAMKENAQLNKVDVTVVEGDAKKVTKTLGRFDRIIMPLPKDAGDFLETTLPALKKDGVVHFYTFAVDKKGAQEQLTQRLGELGEKPEILDTVECGSYNPALSRYCVDFKLAFE